MGERRAGDGIVHLLDGNVLFALVDMHHVHHVSAQRWFAAHRFPFATCPITQGTLLRLLMRVTEMSPTEAVQVLRDVVANARHRYWPDTLDYTQILWRGILGHRQVTDAYLAALARHHGGRLASFDRGLVALHGDVAMAVESV